MSFSAIQDVITIVGSAYLQPITDLVDKLLTEPISRRGPGGTSIHEHGYSAALIILLGALLESYTARLRFMRRDESIAGGSIPELLPKYFPTLPNRDDLTEVFLIRNAIVHNHVWHLDVSDFPTSGTPTLANPKDLGINTNKNYTDFVDLDNRVTRKLRMNVDPTAVNRFDVLKVFEVVWETLKFMNRENFQHTPLAGTSVAFRRKRRDFMDVFEEIRSERDAYASNKSHS